MDYIQRYQVEIGETDKEIIFRFPYSHSPNWTKMKDELKISAGARFSKKPEPHWRAKRSGRAYWVIDLLKGIDRYARYHETPPEVKPKRDVLYDHQKDALNFILHKRRCIMAGEMGTGKTLVLIEALEAMRPKSAWYIAPRFALGQIKLLFRQWKSEVTPLFFSYEEMKKFIYDWPEGRLAPDCVIFDESAYLKSPLSQRTLAAIHLSEGMLRDHADPIIILASGAPAPKSPKDWWSQCEIACPGFIREANIYEFENRLALIEKQESLAGGSFRKIVTWWDNEEKCKHCGEFKKHPNHTKKRADKIKEIDAALNGGLSSLLSLTAEMTHVEHDFEPSVNEVAKLHDRMSGMTKVQFKKDCLNLPEKIYRVIKLEVKPSTRRAISLINRTSTKTIEALTRLRELSDGFQYKQEPSGEFATCPRCAGTGKVDEPGYDICPNCKDGKIEKLKRVAQRVPCPKDDALRELLVECEDRIVIFGGFTATIDRVVDLCSKEGWGVIRVDGTTANLPNSCDVTGIDLGKGDLFEKEEHPLTIFQDKEKYPQPIAFVAHAATAKTSLTLTASNMIVYYSNTFNADDRIQSEDRIHRIGMDPNRGAIIVDLVHLESDMYVRENLKKKRELQSITLGELQEYMNESAQEGQRSAQEGQRSEL